MAQQMKFSKGLNAGRKKTNHRKNMNIYDDKIVHTSACIVAKTLGLKIIGKPYMDDVGTISYILENPRNGKKYYSVAKRRVMKVGRDSIVSVTEKIVSMAIEKNIGILLRITSTGNIYALDCGAIRDMAYCNYHNKRLMSNFDLNLCGKRVPCEEQSGLKTFL